MEKFVIEGGRPLSGTVVPAGNKNGALPALAASLLTEEEVVVRNVPRIGDVETMLALLERLGVRTEWREDHVVALRADNLSGTEVDRVLSERIRARSCTCGSDAALWMTVVPGVRAAAMRAFSVPMTDGSSMKKSHACSPSEAFRRM